RNRVEDENARQMDTEVKLVSGGLAQATGLDPRSADEASSVIIRDVSKTYVTADSGSVEALDRISLTVDAGEMVAVSGPSGCGKSRLLGLIAGLDTPTSGELWIGTEPIILPSAERGLMFQEHNLFPWLTVRGNIQTGLVARGVVRQRRGEVEEIIGL